MLVENSENWKNSKYFASSYNYNYEDTIFVLNEMVFIKNMSLNKVMFQFSKTISIFFRKIVSKIDNFYFL